MPTSEFHPFLSQWFESAFAGVTEPQRLGWPAIHAGGDVLISAPTGSGKTLAAFLHALDAMVRLARDGDFPEGTEILYVSPLKALSNDIHNNLQILIKRNQEVH